MPNPSYRAAIPKVYWPPRSTLYQAIPTYLQHRQCIENMHGIREGHVVSGLTYPWYLEWQYIPMVLGVDCTYPWYVEWQYIPMVLGMATGARVEHGVRVSVHGVRRGRGYVRVLGALEGVLQMRQVHTR